MSRRRESAAFALNRIAGQYGMLGVLVLLALFFSVVTLRDQPATGERAARALAGLPSVPLGTSGGVVIVIREGDDDARFARALEERIRAAGGSMRGVVRGDPAEIRSALLEYAQEDAAQGTGEPQAGVPSWTLATLEAYAPTVRGIQEAVPALRDLPLVTPPPYRWPTFLLPANLRNVANQIAVIAILAVGMTLVILTGGIDLSVGSLIALSAVAAAWIVGHLGGETASVAGLAAGAGAAILLCCAIGAFSGVMITRFGIPPFIATLAMMQVASGLAYIVSQGKPIYRLPAVSVIFGRGADPWLGIPYAVLMMVLLYAGAHLLMARTPLGRYIYAVGGNAEAARLAGVRVGGVLLLVYALCGALAGLGGVLMASQLKSGAPTYGLMYELYVIAAVVVGGTSLSGGEGKILGTLIGAFIIAVIQNGMNLTNVESYTQKVVLGLVILLAVLLDRLKHRGFPWKKRAARTEEAGT